MGVLVQIAEWILKNVNFLANPLLWISAWIATGIASLVSSIYYVARSVVNLFPQFFDYLDRLDAALNAFRAYMAENIYWHFFYNLFSLDVLAQSLSYFLTMAVTIVVLSAVGLAFASFSAVIPFFIYKSVRSVVTTLSAGFIKVN